jgi:NAD+ synthase (glutamine-hydrolysing)
MKLAVAQINCTVGDLAGNAKKILDFTNQAKNKGASLVVTPELALSGYPPEDLLLRKGFSLACINTLENLVKEINGITLLLGHPYFADSKIYNAASVICDGKIIVTYLKNNLLNDTVFKECRYFEPGSDSCIFYVEGIKFGVNISTDVCKEFNVTRAKEKGAEVLLVLCASPYHINKQVLCYKMVRQRICETGITVIYANLVGGQDELVFDGASFVINSKGELTHQFDEFTETLGLVELQNSLPIQGAVLRTKILQASIYSALCLGVKDYIDKNGFTDVLLGLSGGIDSALTLAIAVDALGPERVWAVMMPSEYTTDISLQDSRTMSETLGVRYSEVSIKSVFDKFVSALMCEFQGLQKNDEADTTEENLQARIRGTFLMALSNKYGAIVLTTGNKSEMATGYCTLYGDMAGGFAVLKDISKTMVYQLCQYRNSLSRAIPERVIQRAPSAELRPNQMDQDSLPSYDVLDGIIEAYVGEDKSLEEIIGLGYAKTDVGHIVDLICMNEYKRHQSPMGICVSQRSFSKDWYYPITSKYKDKF